jgi:hypothetical protein
MYVASSQRVLTKTEPFLDHFWTIRSKQANTSWLIVIFGEPRLDRSPAGDDW